MEMTTIAFYVINKWKRTWNIWSSNALSANNVGPSLGSHGKTLDPDYNGLVTQQKIGTNPCSWKYSYRQLGASGKRKITSTSEASPPLCSPGLSVLSMILASSSIELRLIRETLFSPLYKTLNLLDSSTIIK